MKSILYVGATLMIGASIYGFVDYKKTSHKKEFTGMYDEEKISTPAGLPEKKPQTVITSKKDETTKTASGKEDQLTNNSNEIGKTVVDAKTADNKIVVKKVKKKKRLSSKFFSRAPIRENSH